MLNALKVVGSSKTVGASLPSESPVAMLQRYNGLSNLIFSIGRKNAELGSHIGKKMSQTLKAHTEASVLQHIQRCFQMQVQNASRNSQVGSLPAAI